jgi:hypothetical protein
MRTQKQKSFTKLMLETTKQYCVGLSKVYTKESINACWKTFKATKYNADDELKAFTIFVNRNRELLEFREDFNVDEELAKLL